MKAKKGFTLVELLAVIAILAILIIIALPNILKMFNEAQMKLFLQEARNINKAAEDSYLSQKMGTTTPTETIYTYVDGEESSTGNIKVSIIGKKPENGELIIRTNGETALAFHNGKYCAEKGYSDSEVTISDKTKEECIIPFDIAWIYIDSDSSGTVNVGDEITFGTESFYIISNDETNIKALAKYNLYVGGTFNSTWTAYGIEATGLQNNTMKGYVEGQTVSNGTTVFSSDDVKGTNYSDYAGSIVEGYVESYESVLNGLGANIQEATLITKEELESLGCSSTSNTCSSAPDFVKETSYWSGSAHSTSRVWFVVSGGAFPDFDY